MDEKYYLDKLYICNFKPFAYIDSEDKPYYEIDFNQGNARVSMLFSGPNGYGKSSIFQAIEFALMGAQSVGAYSDKIRTIQEHIFVNNLEKPCFVALQLKAEGGQTVTVVRYAEQGIVGNKVDDQREAADFRTYILEEAFVYEQFKQNRQQSNILKAVTKEDIAKRFGEKNIQDWLKRNYIKQEHEYAFIMQKDGERVNLLKGYTDTELDNYFSRFLDEKKAVENECEELVEKLNELSGKVQKEIKAVQGDKPVCGKIMEEIIFDWDKEDYQEDAPFADYAQKAKRTLEYMKNIESYKKQYCAELLSAIKNKEEYYKEYVLTLFEPTKIAEYRNSYQKRAYLRQFIQDEESFYTNSFNKNYLSEKLIAEIDAVRGRKKAFQEMLNEKQRIYNKLEELHRSIKGKETIVTEVFEEKCPLCGSDFQNKEKKLSTAIVEAAEMVQNMKNILDNSLEEQQKGVVDAYLSVVKMIETEAGESKGDQNIYETIENMEKHTDKVNQLKNELGELIVLSGQSKNEKAYYFVNADVFQTKLHKVEDLREITDELKAFIDSMEFDSDETNAVFDTQVYFENKRQTTILQNMSENLIEKVEKKIKQLEWLALEAEAKAYSQNKAEYDKLLGEYRTKCEKNIKLNKILVCRENAKKKYMENVAKYLEIPLYIYSGKLMQTSQNDLGITCFTGNKKDELTQFKMTAGQDEGKGKLDITEKFSAGQRAVANIALILALKKIATANLDVFMIDDPCQSLDELNIASFVEVIKNEFSDTQLILSTHEDKIAAYIKYKFEKANKKMCMFNVHERFYSTP